MPWTALVLAASLGTQCPLRKTAVLGAVQGLTLGTLLLGPLDFVALVY